MYDIYCKNNHLNVFVYSSTGILKKKQKIHNNKLKYECEKASS